MLISFEIITYHFIKNKRKGTPAVGAPAAFFLEHAVRNPIVILILK